MNEFIKMQEDRVIGVLEGWDRMIFNGRLARLSYVEGLDSYLCFRHIRLTEFGAFCQRITDEIYQRCVALAKRAGRPYIYLQSSRARKEELVQKMIAQEHLTEGLVCVLACVEPCQSFELHKNREKRQVELTRTQRKCRHFYLYYLHREFGLIHVRIQSWLPVDVQVYINGRSYLQKRLAKAGIGYTQADNTFTEIADVPKAQEMMHDFTRRNWPATLWKLVRPVMGALLCPDGLLPELRDGYYWTIRQSEYATDVMFKDALGLKEIYPAMCRHAMECLASPDVLRFLGQKSAGKREVTGSYQKRVEGVRVKHSVGSNSVKMYDKAGSVLRVETTINDPGMFDVYRRAQGDPESELRYRRMRKAVADITRRGEVGSESNGRYLAAMAQVHRSVPAHQVLDPVCQRKKVDGQSVRALNPVGADAEIFGALLQGQHLINGFTNRQIQALLFPATAKDDAERRRRSAKVSHRLRLLRRHKLIHKVGRKRLYRATSEGQCLMSLAMKIRASDTKELLAV